MGRRSQIAAEAATSNHTPTALQPNMNRDRRIAGQRWVKEPSPAATVGEPTVAGEVRERIAVRVISQRGEETTQSLR